MGEQSELSEAEREASRWLVRLESPDVTLDDHKRFRAWLSAAPDNRLAFEALSRTWDRLGALQRLTPDMPRRIVGRRTLALAGLAAAAAVFAGVWLFHPDPLPLGIVHATGVGERETIRLVDGSTIELDASSRVVVRFGDELRTVHVDQGAAYFDVRADAARPFVVETAYGAVRVRGTSFLVKLGERAMRTTVFHGVVEGEASRQGPFAAVLLNGDREPVVARANQEIGFDGDGVAVRDIAPRAAERRLAWRDGMLAFDGETLGEAVAEVERQTGVRFAFGDRSLADLRIGGYVSSSDSTAFTALLRDSLGVDAERGPDGVILLRSNE